MINIGLYQITTSMKHDCIIKPRPGVGGIKLAMLQVQSVRLCVCLSHMPLAKCGAFEGYMATIEH